MVYPGLTVVQIRDREMGKRGFFDRTSGLTVAQIVALTGAEVRDNSRLDHLIKDVAPLELAGPSDLTFIESNKYADDLAASHAGACLMPERFEGRAPDNLIVLRTLGTVPGLRCRSQRALSGCASPDLAVRG